MRFKKIFLSESDTFDAKTNNNWGWIRLIAATAVIYSHAFGMSPSGNLQDTSIYNLSRGHTYTGQLAVIVFFFISGALVTKSLYSSISPLDFAIKRFSRIWPALTSCLLLSITLLPVFFGNSTSPRDLINYFTRNISTIYGEFYIQGIFDNHPFKAINGSLWTIPNETRMYLYLLLIFLFFGKMPKIKFMVFQLTVLFYLVLKPELVPLFGSDNRLYGNGLFPLNSIFFILGSLFWLSGFSRLSTVIYFVMSSFTFVFWYISNSGALIFCTATCLFLMGISKLQIKFLHKYKADYSYGLYLYGWPCGQVIYSFNNELSPYESFWCTTALALALAYASWHLVEKQSLRYGRVFSRKVHRDIT